MSSTFRHFKQAIEGHLLIAGAGYLINPIFIDIYKQLGTDYLKSDVFWSLYKVSYAQALYDRNYLYGILITSTIQIQHKTIIKHQTTLDGISAWDEFKLEFEYDGSKELRLEQLETLAQTLYSSSNTGGMATYIDKFQAYIAELEVIAPEDYSDFKKKRMILANRRHAAGVQHLIQKCRDDDFMSY